MKLNKKLYELNKSSLNANEQKQVVNEEIGKAMKEEYGCDKQFAIIFNALELIVNEMPECEHKQELVALLNQRHEIKNKIKKEY